jgi:hypothetical protein
MDDQDVGHLCKLDTRGSLLDLLQELAQDNFTPERQETVTVSFLEYSRLRRGEQRVWTCEEKRGIKGSYVLRISLLLSPKIWKSPSRISGK